MKLMVNSLKPINIDSRLPDFETQRKNYSQTYGSLPRNQQGPLPRLRYGPTQDQVQQVISFSRTACLSHTAQAGKKQKVAHDRYRSTFFPAEPRSQPPAVAELIDFWEHWQSDPMEPDDFFGEEAFQADLDNNMFGPEWGLDDAPAPPSLLSDTEATPNFNLHCKLHSKPLRSDCKMAFLDGALDPGDWPNQEHQPPDMIAIHKVFDEIESGHITRWGDILKAL